MERKPFLTEVKMEKGAVIPPHKHPHEQTGYLVSGHMDFLVDGEHHIAKPGDSWNIAGMLNMARLRSRIGRGGSLLTRKGGLFAVLHAG